MFGIIRFKGKKVNESIVTLWNIRDFQIQGNMLLVRLDTTAGDITVCGDLVFG